MKLRAPYQATQPHTSADGCNESRAEGCAGCHSPLGLGTLATPPQQLSAKNLSRGNWEFRRLAENPTLSHRALIIRRWYEALKLDLYGKNTTICTYFPSFWGFSPDFSFLSLCLSRFLVSVIISLTYRLIPFETSFHCPWRQNLQRKWKLTGHSESNIPRLCCGLRRHFLSCTTLTHTQKKCKKAFILCRGNVLWQNYKVVVIRQTSYLFVSLRASETTLPALKMTKPINSDGPNIRRGCQSPNDAALEKIS